MSGETSLESPYEGIEWERVEQIKGQFHTHTNRPKDSDGHSGSEDAHDIVDFYADAGFGAVTVGDHEPRGPPPLTWPWTALSSIEPTWEDRYPVGTHASAESGETTVDVVAVRGLELGRGGDPEDMVSLYSDLATSPSDENVPTLRAVADRDGIAWLAHPSRYGTADDWGERWWREALTTVDACLGFEIYNPGYDVADSVGIWDAALSDLLPERQVWAFAGDDLHAIDAGYPRAWQSILVEELTPSAVRSALESGATFAQIVTDGEEGSPPGIESIAVDHAEGVITIAATGDEEITWISDGSVVASGPTLAVEESHRPYLRAVVANDAGETSTQPITVR